MRIEARKTGRWRVLLGFITNDPEHALNKTDPETDYGCLDLDNARADLDPIWNDTAPTATQFTVGTAAAVNENAKDFIAYLFRSVKGFSKVFSFEGNGSADGPFVYCGFRPRFILVKAVDTAATGGFLFDSERSTYNPVDDYLRANTADAEAMGTHSDFLSNGFKIRTSAGGFNLNNKTHAGIA
ncbi:MAG: hypothetical protein PVI06_17485, partial [Desulfobacterales bacterium]